MADVKVAIRFRRETGDDLAVSLRNAVGCDNVPDEVAPGLRNHFGCRHNGWVPVSFAVGSVFDQIECHCPA
jgi:hypothetical protein